MTGMAKGMNGAGIDAGGGDTGMMSMVFGPAGAGVGDMKVTVDGGSDREWGRDWWTSAGDGVRAVGSSAWETGAGGDCIAGTASCWATGGRLAGISVNPSPNRRKALSSGGASESLGTGTGVMAAGGGAWDNDCIAARWAWACNIETRVAALSVGEGVCDRGGGTVTAHVTTGTVANPSRMGQNAPSSSCSNDSSGRGSGRKSGTSVGSSEDGMTGATGVLACDSGQRDRRDGHWRWGNRGSGHRRKGQRRRRHGIGCRRQGTSSDERGLQADWGGHWRQLDFIGWQA